MSYSIFVKISNNRNVNNIVRLSNEIISDYYEELNLFIEEHDDFVIDPCFVNYKVVPGYELNYIDEHEPEYLIGINLNNFDLHNRVFFYNLLSLLAREYGV